MINLISLNGKTVYEINEELISAQGLKAMDALKNGQSTSEIEWKKSLDRANADLLKQQQQLKQTQQKLNQSQQQVSQTKEQLVTNSKISSIPGLPCSWRKTIAFTFLPTDLPINLVDLQEKNSNTRSSNPCSNHPGVILFTNKRNSSTKLSIPGKVLWNKSTMCV
jgi:hypothetical protein